MILAVSFGTSYNDNRDLSIGGVEEIQHSTLPIEGTQLRKITVRGTVLDGEGQPLPGVTVMIENTTDGTVTDGTITEKPIRSDGNIPVKEDF